MNRARRLFIWLVLLAMHGATVAAAEEIVRLGSYPGPKPEWSRTELRTTFDLWGQELARKFRIPVRFTYYDSPTALHEDFLAGKIDGVQADAMTFVRYFKPDELAEGYATMMKGGWNMMLFASNDHAPLDLAGLTGKRIAVVKEDPAIDLYLETLCLRYHQHPCNEVFGDIQPVTTSNQALMRVFFGKADAALVYGYGYEVAVEMNPQLGRALRKLAEYPITSLFFGFYSAKTDKRLRDRTLPVMPTLHTYPRGRQLLDIFKIERLETVTAAALQPALDLEREYQQLKAQIAQGVKRR